jgi:intracellular sulfur oxidation DsrE/DsrF family protein
VLKNVLEDTMKAWILLALEVTYVRSGVAEIARLQQREGYAYLRP